MIKDNITMLKPPLFASFEYDSAYSQQHDTQRWYSLADKLAARARWQYNGLAPALTCIYEQTRIFCIFELKTPEKSAL